MVELAALLAPLVSAVRAAGKRPGCLGGNRIIHAMVELAAALDPLHGRRPRC